MTDTPIPNLGGPSLSPTGPKTVSQVLGELVWLMTQSQTHKQLFLGDLEWFAMPAILLEQFRLFYGPTPETPAAVALWASVSEETEERLMAGAQKLRPDEWKNGDRMWLIELIAPFGAQDEIMRDLAGSVFEGKSFKFHHLNPQGVRAVASYDAQTGELV